MFPDEESSTRFVYDGPEYEQNGAVCERRVVVAYRRERNSEPVPAEIITSFGNFKHDA
jgi:hypothetical protein